MCPVPSTPTIQEPRSSAEGMAAADCQLVTVASVLSTAPPTKVVTPAAPNTATVCPDSATACTLPTGAFDGFQTTGLRASVPVPFSSDLELHPTPAATANAAKKRICVLMPGCSE